MNLESVWMLLCGGLIFFMQAGFTCYEAGFVQSKNVISVTIENLLTFAITVIIFTFIGFPIMFGHGQPFWLMRTSSQNPDDIYLFLFVQIMFAAVSVTIFAGAMSERTKLVSLLIASFFSAGIIYPVFGQWVWGNHLGIGGAWLQKLGFIDFAGASVVHTTAGFIALAGLLVAGGRKNQNVGKSNIPLATLGVFILWFGWLGFNGVNQSGFDELGLIFINTMLSATLGMGGAIGVNFIVRRKGGYMISIFNGVLAGLVSITALSKYCHPFGAALVGLVAGACSELVLLLLRKHEIDDVVNVTPTHLCGGIVGCFLVPFFCVSGHNTFWQQLGIQCLGIAVNGIWAFGTAYLMFRLIDRFIGLRVRPEEEEKGLNIVEFNDIYSWEKYIEISSYEAQIQEKNTLLRKQARLLVVTQAQEKNNLAKELHDGVGQSLAALKLLLHLNQKYAEQIGNEKLQKAAKQAADLADTSIGEIRNVLNDLRPQYLEQGLQQGLQFMTQNLSTLGSFTCTLEIGGSMPAFEDTVALNIYRLVQEALTNVVKHAKADSAVVHCAYAKPSTYLIEIRDDGIGFQLQEVIQGVGLGSMQDRIQMLGGQMKIFTSPGKGTRVILEVPLDEA